MVIELLCLRPQRLCGNSSKEPCRRRGDQDSSALPQKKGGFHLPENHSKVTNRAGVFLMRELVSEDTPLSCHLIFTTIHLNVFGG
ncbi:hypothetical protein PoB_004027000 [Plakobranchus ocellatus]|uniref:Uncharacterized protein n=1 Tax=Plakobranchus ocellatus TaxID=259542 RepID=A0AAV4AZI0_9GAST|nr:hypothetical protein PoB_004027000 [Plakobranchus ocellatus]